MSAHAAQNLLPIRKKFLLSRGSSSEYKDLAKFAEDTYPHLFRQELEDSLKKAKERHYSLQTLKPMTTLILPLSENPTNFQRNDRPTKKSTDGHKGTPQYNSPSI